MIFTHYHHSIYSYHLKYIAIVGVMSQNGNPQTQESYLETVIDCITDRNASKVDINAQDASLNQLYGQADNMIHELDRGISICKKYNEAKINRKYEIIINDLQAEIAKLRMSLNLEKQNRSPGKKHVSDLLEKMVAFKLDNEALLKENNELKAKVKLLEEELNVRNSQLSEMQLQHTKSTGDKLPPIHLAPLTEAVRQFLKQKEQTRKQNRAVQSGLEKLLIQLKPKVFTLSIGNLLQEIDKWVEGSKYKSHQQSEVWRIRSSIAQKFSDCVDEPQSLLKLSARKEEGLWQKLSAKHKEHKKYSHLGSKHSLNASFH